MANHMDVSDSPSDAAPCEVEAEGTYGWITWIPTMGLYSALPAETRDEILEMAGERNIKPAMESILDRVLDALGLSCDRSQWSDELDDVDNITIKCGSVGEITWQISTELWEHIPEDDRDETIEVMKLLIHTEILHDLLGANLRRFITNRQAAR